MSAVVLAVRRQRDVLLRARAVREGQCHAARHRLQRHDRRAVRRFLGLQESAVADRALEVQRFLQRLLRHCHLVALARFRHQAVDVDLFRLRLLIAALIAGALGHGIQRAVRVEFDRRRIIFHIVLQLAGDLDRVSDRQRLDRIRHPCDVRISLHPVALDRLVLTARDLDRDRDVPIGRIINSVDRCDHACQGLLAFQRFAARQCVRRIDDLLVIAVVHDRIRCADRHDLDEFAARGKFILRLAAVRIDKVGQETSDLDRVVLLNGVRTVALHTVAKNRLVGLARDHDGDGNVLVGRIIRRVHFRDHAGQRLFVFQGLLGRQCVERVHDRRFGSKGLRRMVADRHDLNEGAARIEFDLGLATLGIHVMLQDTFDLDRIVLSDGIRAIAFQTVALDRFVGLACHHDGDRDVTVGSVIRRVDLRDDARQGLRIVHRIAGRQCVRCIDDLRLGAEHLNRSRFADFDDLFQNTTGVEFDRAVVVLDDALDFDRIVLLDRFCAFALQTVAHDRLVFLSVHDDGDRDVLVAFIIRGIHLRDDADQRHFLVHGFAGLKRIRPFEDLIHVGGADDVQHVFEGSGGRGIALRYGEFKNDLFTVHGVGVDLHQILSVFRTFDGDVLSAFFRFPYDFHVFALEFRLGRKLQRRGEFVVLAGFIEFINHLGCAVGKLLVGKACLSFRFGFRLGHRLLSGLFRGRLLVLPAAERRQKQHGREKNRKDLQ